MTFWSPAASQKKSLYIGGTIEPSAGLASPFCTSSTSFCLSIAWCSACRTRTSFSAGWPSPIGLPSLVVAPWFTCRYDARRPSLFHCTMLSSPLSAAKSGGARRPIRSMSPFFSPTIAAAGLS